MTEVVAVVVLWCGHGGGGGEVYSLQFTVYSWALPRWRGWCVCLGFRDVVFLEPLMGTNGH